jgi:hypothetical protein
MKAWRSLEAGLASSSFLTFAFNWMLSFWLWKEMPRLPDPLTGYTIAIVMKGVTVYLNPTYWFVFYGSFWGSMLAFFGAVLIDFYKNPFQWRRK